MILQITQLAHATYRIFEKFSIQEIKYGIGHEPIILQPTNATDATTTYEIKFDFSQNPLPSEGDTLYIITNKTITSNDVFRFAIGNNKVINSVK